MLLVIVDLGQQAAVAWLRGIARAAVQVIDGGRNGVRKDGAVAALWIDERAVGAAVVAASPDGRRGANATEIALLLLVMYVVRVVAMPAGASTEHVVALDAVIGPT